MVEATAREETASSVLPGKRWLLVKCYPANVWHVSYTVSLLVRTNNATKFITNVLVGGAAVHATGC